MNDEAASLQRGQLTLPPSSTAELEFPTAPDRLERLATWLEAVDGHQPGVDDAALRAVASWNAPELQGLWIDVNSLVRMMRNPRVRTLSITNQAERLMQIVYTSSQLKTLRALACAAAGHLDAAGATAPPGSVDRDCEERLAAREVTAELRAIAHRLGIERVRRGDDNLVLRRAALLHADVAMLKPPTAETTIEPFLPIGPRRTRLEVRDGRGVGIALSGMHWELAETVLEYVKPADAEKPAPERDELVGQWYQATVRWMHLHQEYDSGHLEKGRALFPDDPVLLFLEGCEHEFYASPTVQSVRASSAPGTPMPARSGASEWRAAADLFSRAAEGPDSAETRLRLGRVLTELGRPADAAASLRESLPGLETDQLRYYGELFLGEAEEQLGHYDLARDRYQRAHDLFPNAQTPLLALSQLARRRDDRAAALDAITALFRLGIQPGADDDPWWSYQVSHVRDADDGVKSLWQAFLSPPS